jgi:hypothetical protein
MKTEKPRVEKPKYRGIKHLGAIFDEIRKPIYAQHGLTHARILDNWNLIVGDRLAKISRPKRIAFIGQERVNGSLIVELNNPAFALELDSMKGTIIARVATYVGYNAVSRVKFEVLRKNEEPGQKVEHTDEGMKVKLSNIEQEEVARSIEGVNDEEAKLLLASMAKLLFEKE